MKVNLSKREQLTYYAKGMIYIPSEGTWAPLHCVVEVAVETEGAVLGNISLFRELVNGGQDLIVEDEAWVPKSMVSNAWVLGKKCNVEERISNKRWNV